MNAPRPDPAQDSIQMLRYLDGDLDDAELAQLNVRLAGSASLRHELAALLIQRVSLIQIAQEEQLRLSLQPAALEPLPSENPWRRGALLMESVARYWKWLAGLAAFSASLALIVWGARFCSNSARLMEVGGTVLVQTESGNFAARPGTLLPPGSQLVLAPEASATVGYRWEATQLRLTAGARLRIESARAGKACFLERGMLSATVARHRRSAPFVIRTSEAVARILGTEFVLSASDKATRLEVWSGEVRLIRTEDGSSANVVGGQFAIATAGLPLRTEAVQGGVLGEVWRDIPGSRVVDLTSHPAFPTRPAEVFRLDRLEQPANLGDTYGVRLRTWLHPPRSGEYRFWIAADDQAEFWLSSDESAGRKRLLCFTPQYTQSREWGKYPEQKSAVVFLEAGRCYYTEVLMKQAGGFECLAVAWQGPFLPLQVVEGQYLSSLFPPPLPGRPE